MINRSNRSKFVRLLLVAIMMLAVSSCGGGGGGGGGGGQTLPSPIATNAGGLWDGSTFNDQSGQTVPTIGVVTEGNGDGRFVNADGIQFILSGVSGNDGALNATITAIAPIGFVFLDGSTVTAGTLTATVIERTSIEGSWVLNTGETGTITMSYDALYERDSDLSLTAGMWTDSFGVVYTVQTNGDFFGQDSFGCVFDGAISIINAAYNAYRLIMTISLCPGINGDYSGLGVLVDFNGTNDGLVVQMDNGSYIFTDLFVKQ